MSARRLAGLLAASACGGGDAPSTLPPGYVVRFHLDAALDRARVTGLEAVISKDGGFPGFAPATDRGVTVTSADRDGDGANEAVLTWAKGTEFAATMSVVLAFENPSAAEIRIDATAFEGDVPVARGAAEPTVPAGGRGEADVDLACVVAGCGPPADGGADAGADAGVDGSVDGGDGGADATVPAQQGEVVTAAGKAEGGGYTLWHEAGHAVDTMRASGGSLDLDAVITVNR